MRDPRYEPQPGDVLSSQGISEQRYVIANVFAAYAKQQRVLIDGSEKTITMKEYRKWAANKTVELVAQIDWYRTQDECEKISHPYRGRQYSIRREPEGFALLQRPVEGERWDPLAGTRPQPSVPQAMAYLEELLQEDKKEVQQMAKAIAGNLLRADIDVSSLFPDNAEEVRGALFQLSQDLLEEAGPFSTMRMGCRLRPVQEGQASLMFGDDVLMRR